jgi:hypothetical protein
MPPKDLLLSADVLVGAMLATTKTKRVEQEERFMVAVNRNSKLCFREGERRSQRIFVAAGATL